MSLKYYSNKHGKKCLTCKYNIDCINITNCPACGFHGRPRCFPISAGVLIIDPEIKKILLIYEKGCYSDIGGKFDPDKDCTLFDTVFRELKEESGLYLIKNIVDAKYIDLDKNAYRLYIIYNTKDSPAYTSTSKISNNIYNIPINELTTINLRDRFQLLLNTKINNADITLENYLNSI